MKIVLDYLKYAQALFWSGAEINNLNDSTWYLQVNYLCDNICQLALIDLTCVPRQTTMYNLNVWQKVQVAVIKSLAKAQESSILTQAGIITQISV